jgi:virulence-associated protein VagC
VVGPVLGLTLWTVRVPAALEFGVIWVIMEIIRKDNRVIVIDPMIKPQLTVDDLTLIALAL